MNCPACGHELTDAKNMLAFDCHVYDCVACGKRYQQSASIWDELASVFGRPAPPLEEIEKKEIKFPP